MSFCEVCENYALLFADLTVLVQEWQCSVVRLLYVFRTFSPLTRFFGVFSAAEPTKIPLCAIIHPSEFIKAFGKEDQPNESDAIKEFRRACLFSVRNWHQPFHHQTIVAQRTMHDHAVSTQ